MDDLLSPYTEAELRQRAELRRRLEQEEAQAEARNQADRACNGFMLTGSTRPADLPGQGSLF